MRYSLLLLAFLLLPPEGATAQTFEVTTSVNDLTGVRRIASADLRPLPALSYSGSHAAFRAVYTKDPDEGSTWELVLFGYASDTTEVTRVDEIRLRTDRAQLTPSRVESRIRTMENRIVEIKRMVLSRSHFEQVAQTDSLLLSFGSAKFEMSRVLRTDMRLILEQVSSEGARPAAKNQPQDTSDARDRGGRNR